jgi:Ni/Co efflux regulator RcnB
MKNSHIAVCTAIAAAFMLGTPAFAKDHGDKGMEKAQKHADKEERKAEKREHKEEIRQGQYFNDNHRQQVHGYYAEHYGGRKGCPPGLAKKQNGCMPPGQARKWDVGQPLPRNVVVYSVPQPVLTYLPAAPAGYRYQRVGGDLVLVRNNDRVVVDIMLNIF